MSNKGLINEFFWLRCVACLAVVMGHSFQSSYNCYIQSEDQINSLYIDLYHVLYLGILFGTPVFVFISEFLLSKRYPVNVPAGFIKKRLKFLFIPYVFMSIMYALTEMSEWTIRDFIIESSKNIFLGDSTLYFILIIFQFYFLHLFFNKHLNRLSPKKVIPIAFLINILYLSIFNFFSPPNLPYANYLWKVGYWVPFVGWIFYFILGYYCGKNYRQCLTFLHKYKILVIGMPMFSFSIVLVLSKFVVIMPWSSKRIDMILYSTSVILFIIYISSRIKEVPKTVMFISRYSFSIYLLHQFFLMLFPYVKLPVFLNMISYILCVFVLSISLSIITSYLLNKFSFGQYVVGTVKNFKKDKPLKVEKIKAYS
ncbi:acyltransferase family protein [Priestia megaterium]|uniref:acyltransferase family protein n=1 Tax=Priestia megaterium TaxID=1404 RepID=UPI002DB66893|nr:acyltransferase family protein [Priestia megaterium]MEC1072274.1 acyltransferase family protein [Priestia megaterium]